MSADGDFVVDEAADGGELVELLDGIRVCGVEGVDVFPAAFHGHDGAVDGLEFAILAPIAQGELPDVETEFYWEGEEFAVIEVGERVEEFARLVIC